MPETATNPVVPDAAAQGAPLKKADGPARVSVIVPARNADKYIEQTFESLLAQTDQSWQAIIINDKSTDRTQEIIDNYIARYPGKFVCHQGPGVGVSSARNLALDKAQGERIMFLDSDDWVEPDWLELMNGALDRTPGAVVAYCGYIRAMSDGQLHKLYLDPMLAVDAFRVLARSCEVGIHCVLIDKQELDTVGRFDTTLKTSEDWDLWQRLSRRGKPWVMVNKHLSYYRTGHQSLSQDIDSIMAMSERVLKRGFSRDPRVPGPARKNAKGARMRYPGEFRDLIAGNSLWCVSSSLGRGRPLEQARALVRPYTQLTLQSEGMAHVLVESFMQGAGLTADSLTAQWEVMKPRMEAVLHLINEQWKDDAKIAELRRDIENKIIALHESKAPTRFGNRLLVGIDLREPVTLEPVAGTDRVIARLFDGDTQIGQVTAALLEPITPEDWERLALLGLGHDELERRFPQMLQRVLARQSERLLSTSDDAPDFEFERSADAATWEQFFGAKKNPFGYDGAYEREKFERTLAMIEGIAAENVLELACAEGHFSERLAGRVGRLTATDVSQTAVERAQARCAGHDNASFAHLDMVRDPLPVGLDVIFCSEVLYYLASEADIAAFARKAANALVPGGHLISTHPMMVQDDRTKTGFDWSAPYGAETFARIFSETPGLALERSDQTELYRIDRFVKLAPDAKAPAPQINKLPLGALPGGPARRDIYWGGTEFCRSDFEHETRDFVPVLMYHAIADSGPKGLDRYRTTPAKFREQMQWLRRNGFYTVTSQDIAKNLARHERFYGRPIVITFDDGMQNFADNAWPILKEFGFVPEMFLVTDLLGKSTTWDAQFGQTYPLMTGETIKRLAAEGVVFGSHMATHPKSDQLTTEALRDELVRSRAAMQQLLGEAPMSVAAPYGLIDTRYADVAWRAGYAVAYSCDQWMATLKGAPLLLPRLEVTGQMSLEQFKSLLTLCLRVQFEPMESDDLISVVVPVHNFAVPLEWTLKSIRAQSHRNLEIIVVDDGSDDASLDVANQQAAEDARIRVLSQPRSGLAQAREAGWRVATGKAVAFIKPGDYCDDDKIKKLYSALLQSPEDVGVAYSWWHTVDESGSEVGSRAYNFADGNLLPQLVHWEVAGDGGTTLIRRSALEAIGGYLGNMPAGPEGSDGHWLQIRLAERFRYALVPEHLSYCRQRPVQTRPEQIMETWFATTDAVTARHPELAKDAKKGLRHSAKQASRLALKRRKFKSLVKVMQLVAARDPVVAAQLPLNVGVTIARGIKKRVGRFGLLPTAKFYLERFVTRR